MNKMLLASEIPWGGSDELRLVEDRPEPSQPEATAARPADAVPFDEIDEPPNEPAPTVDPPAAESRQVRRARERREAKAAITIAAPTLHHQTIAHPTSDPFPLTEAGDAEFFVEVVTGRYLYDHQRRRWFRFGPHHWRLDTTERIVQAAIAALRQRQAHALKVMDEDQRKKRLRWTIAGESEARVHHLLDLASSHPQLAIEGSEWDRDPWTLGVENGAVDLRTATLRPGDPNDRITRVAAVPYDPEAPCPRWERFILEISDGDAGLATFHQRSFGYALTDETTEQCFWIFYGLGSNGKSTLLEVLTQYVIPEHSWTMPFPVASWTESMSEYQRAELVGRRLIIAKESEQQKRLNTEFVKSLTGGDAVNARHPYGRPFTFIPAAKFVLACNHRPIIRDDSHGMWRRVRLVPFARTFPIDLTLIDVLAAEAPGILRWAVEGCLAWQRHGLHPPAIVTEATEAYARDCDNLAQFIETRCAVVDYGRSVAGALFAAYTAWCDAERIPEPDRLSLRGFGERMKRRFPPLLGGKRVVYTGIALLDEDPDRG